MHRGGVKVYKRGKFKTSKRVCLVSRMASLLISAPFGAWAKKGTLRPFFEMELYTFYNA